MAKFTDPRKDIRKYFKQFDEFDQAHYWNEMCENTNLLMKRVYITQKDFNYVFSQEFALHMPDEIVDYVRENMDLVDTRKRFFFILDDESCDWYSTDDIEDTPIDMDALVAYVYHTLDPLGDPALARLLRTLTLTR